MILRRGWQLVLCDRASLRREGKSDSSAAINLACCRGRTSMQIGDGFYQGQTQAGSFGTARRINPVKSIEDTREVVRRDSTAGIFHRQLRPAVLALAPDRDVAPVRSESQCVVEKVAQGSIEQQRVGVDVAIAFIGDGDTSLFRDRAIVGRDLFNGRSCRENIFFDVAIARFCASEKQEVLDNSGKLFAFTRNGLNDVTVVF